MNHCRHADLFDCSNLSVTIVGAGGIGAVLALTLAKMGVSYMTVIDDDQVSEENLATQLHAVNDVGKFKALCLKNTVEIFSDDVQYLGFTDRIGPNATLKDQLIISAVDSIQARKDIWAASRGNSQWYFDLRMGAEVAQLCFIDQADSGWYSNMLAKQDDNQFEPVPCTQKSTFFAASLISGLAGSALRKVLTGLPMPKMLTFDMISNTVMQI